MSTQQQVPNCSLKQPISWTSSARVWPETKFYVVKLWFIQCKIKFDETNISAILLGKQQVMKKINPFFPPNRQDMWFHEHFNEQELQWTGTAHSVCCFYTTKWGSQRFHSIWHASVLQIKNNDFAVFLWCSVHCLLSWFFPQHSLNHSLLPSLTQCFPKYVESFHIICHSSSPGFQHFICSFMGLSIVMK